ncbi:MAG: type II toxin-antitoxin system VapC family toxin [Actinomycetota bacterium]|nr:type II toxin-antitoxin system VapC family toxin [Actinomycetota bacterium]
MITAVDSNILIDFFVEGQRFSPSSRKALRGCAEQGAIVACEIVVAEVGAHFPSSGAASAAFESMGITFEALDFAAALVAAEAWRSYRRRGGKRDRMVADFLIGAHAQTRADRLLTRDRGFYRTNFKRLRLIDPTSSAR